MDDSREKANRNMVRRLTGNERCQIATARMESVLSTPKRITGRDINLYIIERLYERIKVSNRCGYPENTLKKGILTVALENGNTPKVLSESVAEKSEYGSGVRHAQSHRGDAGRAG